MREEIINQGAHAALPVGYTTFYAFMTDPQQIIGFIVLALQGIYWIVKILESRKKRNEKQIDEGNCGCNACRSESNGA